MAAVAGGAGGPGRGAEPVHAQRVVRRGGRVGHRQRLDPADEVGAQVVGLAHRADVGHAPGDLPEHQPDFHLGQVGPQAVVGAAAAEPDVVIGAALYVEAPRVVEGPGVPVGGDVPHHHLVARGDRHPAQLVVLHGLAAEVQHRGGPPHDLLDRGGHVPVGVGCELGPLVFEVEEGHHPPGDRVAGGLVARHRQDQEEHVELVLAEGLAVHVRGKQGGDDVLGRAAPPVGLELVGVAVEVHRGLGHLFGAGHHVGVFAADEHVGPLEDLGPVPDGDAHHLGDGLQGQLGRHLGDEVAAAPLGDLIQDQGGAVLEVVLEQADHAGGEAPVDQPPVAGVGGRVHVYEHVVPLVLAHGVGGVGLEHLGAAVVGREHLGGTVHLFEMGVAGDGPVAGAQVALVDPVDSGVGLAQLLQGPVVLLALEHVVVPEVDVGLGGLHHARS